MSRLAASALCLALLLTGCGRGEADRQQPAAAKPAGAAPEVVPVEPASPIKPGIYGNVESNTESGDLGGIEIELHAGPAQIVEMTLCEGWCNAIVRSRYRVEKGAVGFTFRQGNINADGSPAGDLVVPIRLVPRGADVLLEAPAFGDKPTLLKRLPKRNGLDIAAQTMASKPGSEKPR